MSGTYSNMDQSQKHSVKWRSDQEVQVGATKYTVHTSFRRICLGDHPWQPLCGHFGFTLICMLVTWEHLNFSLE